MKNIMIVSNKGNAIALGKDLLIKKTGLGSFVPALEAIKEVLGKIGTELEEETCIYVPNALLGLCTGSAISYLRTKKTGQDNSLSEEELALFKEVYTLYGARILNVRFLGVKYIKPKFVELLKIKELALAELNKMAVNTNVAKSIIVDPDKKLRDMFDKQIETATEAGDMDKAMKLMEMRSKLKEPTQAISKTEDNCMKFNTEEVSTENTNAESIEDSNDTGDFEFCEGTLEIAW